MVLPELLAGILAGNTLEDCACMSDYSFFCGCTRSLTLLSSRVLILELGQVVDVLVDDDVEIVRLVVRRHVAGGKCFGHCDKWCLERKGYQGVDRCRKERERGMKEELQIPGVTLARSVVCPDM